MKNLKKLTLLHSNDMHGDFLAEKMDEKLVGGVSMLSGYINKVRQEEENVLYAIAGDMFRGSIIDSEFKGLSTIHIMNMLAPDIATVGNHEIDYGVSHLLFLEKCAEFPIINANLHIKTNNARLFEPCKVIEIDGMKILFIGVLTEAALRQCQSDDLIGTFITLEDAVAEIGRICDTYNAIDVDLTVLLTHIGFEEDCRLAKMLNPAWGVDVIVGGHSHTFLDEPAVVNGIPIVQAGTGTDQIGRFDMFINTGDNCIDSYTWEAVPINEETCPKDPALEEIITGFKNSTDEKYGRIITKFVRPLTHPSYIMETELGNLYTDLLKKAFGVDIMILGSASIRTESLGPVVTKKDFDENYPYDDGVYVTYWTGEQFVHGIQRMLRDEALEGGYTEFFQLSSGFEIEYDQKTHSFLKFDFCGRPIEKDKVYTVGIQHFHFMNLKDCFDIDMPALAKNHPARQIATACGKVLEEMLQMGQHQDSRVEGRLVIHRA